MQTFELVGIPRSGQHAIATWLMANLPSPSLFINNSTSIRPDHIWYVDGRRRVETFSHTPIFTGIGLEGPASLANSSILPTVFVLRDIKNHMASLIKHRTLRPVWDKFFNEWEEYANLALGDGTKRYKYLVVPFSSWHCSQPFRRDIFEMFAEIVGCSTEHYNDNARKDVMASGGGSSFDGESFVGCGDKMRVLERYKSVELPKIPGRLLDLNELIFGDVYN